MIEDSSIRSLSDLWLLYVSISSANETALLACVDALESLEAVESSGYVKLGSPLDTLEWLESSLFKDLGSIRPGKLVVEEVVLKVVDSSSPLCGSLISCSPCFLILFSLQ